MRKPRQIELWPVAVVAARPQPESLQAFREFMRVAADLVPPPDPDADTHPQGSRRNHGAEQYPKTDERHQA